MRWSRSGRARRNIGAEEHLRAIETSAGSLIGPRALTEGGETGAGALDHRVVGLVGKFKKSAWQPSAMETRFAVELLRPRPREIETSAGSLTRLRH